MRYPVSLLILLAVVVTLAGCPRILPVHHSFTSADFSGGYRLFDGVMTPGLDNVAGENGEPEREVVEPDLIRRDGNLLYILNQYRGLTIVDLDTEEMLAQVPTFGYPRDLYFDGTYAYVLVGYAGNFTELDGVVSATLGSRIFVVDVRDPAAAAIRDTFDLEGDFIDSRLVGDVLYAISAEYQYSWVDGGDVVVSVDRVAKEQTSASWVTSLNLADPDNIQIDDQLSFDGYGSLIQATNYAIFVASSDWGTDITTITYVDISDPNGAISVRGNVAVPGYMSDRFKMNAYEGVLRVVTNTGWRDRNVYVTTVDLQDPDDLGVLGQVTIPDAAGETLFATRFDGPLAYIVTYLVVDPLFVLDLSDPANPHVAGLLKVPGWSTHIEPRGDYLIALGVDDTAGRQVKVSLFDVSNPEEPLETDAVSFGEGWSWSSAYGDVKAFTVLDDVLIVPFSGWTEAGGFERLQFVSYTPDDLTLRGYIDVEGQILRSFEYGGYYWAVTTEQLVKIDGSDLSAPVALNRLTLAEYVHDYLELSNGVAVAVVSRLDRQSTLVRTETLDGEAVGEVEIVTGQLNAVHVYGATLLLVTNGWEETGGYYLIFAVDCSTPESPVVAKLKVDVEPYWGYWWWWGDRPGVPMPLESDAAPGAEAGSKAMPYYRVPWYDPSDISFLLGDLLVLRCGGQKYDETFGPETPWQGVALIDLESMEWTRTVGFGYPALESVNAAGNKLYIGTKEEQGMDMRLRPVCAYYLREFDPAAVTMGPAANVPGRFLAYNPGNNVLLLEDVQYDAGWNVNRWLRSAIWAGGAGVRPVDSLEVSGYGTLLPTNNRVFFDAYDNGYVLGSVAVSNAGRLLQGEKTKVSDLWAWLAAANDNTAYVVINGAVIARYDMSGSPALRDMLPVMSSPLRFRFGTENAYAPMGYAGLAVLPL